MPLPLQLAIYCVLIILAAVLGGYLPSLVKLTHRRMQVILSVIGGFMLGVSLLDLLPHAAEVSGDVTASAHWMLLGMLVMFFIERFFCFHHHDTEEIGELSPEAGQSHDHDHDPGHHHSHDHDHDGDPEAALPRHRLSWGGAAAGLGLHSMINGMGLAAAMAAEAESHAAGFFTGLGVFLIIVLHKPFDSMALSSLMAVGGHPQRSRLIVSILFALQVPVGALLFYLGLGWFHDHPVVGPALAFSAGTFLCIAMSDLLPELQFHQHDRLKLSLYLLLGLGLAWGITQLEEQHEHGHDHQPPAQQQKQHEHHDHAH